MSFKTDKESEVQKLHDWRKEHKQNKQSKRACVPVRGEVIATQKENRKR
jgi:hypothetical protein